MKRNIGDRVRIKSLDSYNMHCDDAGNVDCGCEIFEKDMKPYLGKVFTIHRIVDNSKYEMEEAFDFFLFTDEMIEGLVEEENLIERVDDNGLPFNEWLSHKGFFYVPDGYELKDENGNVINATKIVLEKKKKEYPKTYEECCKVLGCKANDFFTDFSYNCCDVETSDYEDKIDDLLENFRKLIYCRDAYWKIAGEEMGLGKPWEPDYAEESYEQGSPIKYVIYYTGTHITKERKCTPSYVLSFPTEEMRDAFYENFKEDIEFCKELL